MKTHILKPVESTESIPVLTLGKSVSNKWYMLGLWKKKQIPNQYTEIITIRAEINEREKNI